MMRWRNLLVGVAVLGVLSGFVYFYEFKGEAKREQAKEKAEKLFDVKEQDIIEIILQHGEEKMTFALKSGRWEAESPVHAAADQNAVVDIARNLSSVNAVRSLTGAQNLVEYGLQPAKRQMSFKTRQGSSYSLDLGEKDYSEMNVYARGSTRSGVILVPSFLLASMDKSLFQLRDRKVMEIDTEKVIQIEYVSGTDHISAKKSGAGWKLTQPLSTRVDSLAISSFLSDVLNSEVTEFVDRPEANRKKYGLNPPEATLTLTLENGGKASSKKLLFGSKTGDQFYIENNDDPTILRISSATAEKIRPTAFKLRGKHIVAVNSADLQRVSISYEGGNYEFERGNSKDAKWKIVQPKNLAGKEAREWKFWFPLEDLLADEILDPPKSRSKATLFSAPAVRATLLDKTDRQTEIRFSKPQKDSVWIRTSASDSVYRVSSQKIDEWISGLKDSLE